jgi:hypothetical protein
VSHFFIGLLLALLALFIFEYQIFAVDSGAFLSGLRSIMVIREAVLKFLAINIYCSILLRWVALLKVVFPDV